MPAPRVTGFYHEATSSVAYLVADEATGHAAIIDPVLDFDENSARVSTRFADAMLATLLREKFTLQWILDTHPHADHFSAAAYLKEQTGVQIAIGAKVARVQALWTERYAISDFTTDSWDRLFAAGDTFSIGDLQARVMDSPGHTPASISYVIGDAAFIHDTLFQPDFGTARADFPGGDAGELYDSIQAILALPDETRLFTGHDYRPNGRPAAWQASVAQQRGNKHLKDHPARDAFVRFREERDKTLPLPKLMLHALQVNLRGGRLPPPDENGRRFLKIPVEGPKRA